MSKDAVYEDVPGLTRRVGDCLLAGENNAAVLLGRDRLGSVDSGYGSRDSETKGRGAGAVHLMAGRVGADPSIADDRATVYLSALTDPDVAAGTDDVGTSRTKKSAVVMRADCLRLSPRVDVKISVGKAYITMTAEGVIELDGQINLTKGASDSVIKGEAFQQIFNSHGHPQHGAPPTVRMTSAVMNPKVRV